MVKSELCFLARLAFTILFAPWRKFAFYDQAWPDLALPKFKVAPGTQPLILLPGLDSIAPGAQFYNLAQNDIMH